MRSITDWYTSAEERVRVNIDVSGATRDRLAAAKESVGFPGSRAEFIGRTLEHLLAEYAEDDDDDEDDEPAPRRRPARGRTPAKAAKTDAEDEDDDDDDDEPAPRRRPARGRTPAKAAKTDAEDEDDDLSLMHI